MNSYIQYFSLERKKNLINRIMYKLFPNQFLVIQKYTFDPYKSPKDIFN